MPPRSVVLIGFMGAGKTVVGRALAERLGFEFVDTDELVAARAARSIPEIFGEEGELGFRAREHQAVLEACAHPGRVVACGGGAILQLRNYGILRGAGRMIYLRATREALRARVGAGADRPMLSAPDRDERFDRLLAERIPAYESAADHVVDTDGRTPDEVADEIAALVRGPAPERAG